MNTRRRLRAVITASLIALVSVSMAACGDDDEDSDQAATTTTAEEAEGEAQVTIDMQDYAFDVSGALAEGGSIEFTNSGKELHMVGFGKLKSGKTLEDVTEMLEKQSEEQSGSAEEEEGALAPTRSSDRASRSQHASTTTTAAAGGEEEHEEGEDPFAELMEEVGLPGSFYMPGTTVTLNADMLDTGTYALLCFIPTEGGGPPHFAQGMVGELEVVDGEAVEEPEPAATYKLASDGKFTGPATLSAGEHTIAIEVGDGAEEQEPGMAKLKGNTTFEQLDEYLNKLDESEEIPKGTAAGVPAEFLVGLFDVEDTEMLYLTLEFTAGTYYLVSEDSDDESEKAPAPLKITVR